MLIQSNARADNMRIKKSKRNNKTKSIDIFGMVAHIIQFVSTRLCARFARLLLVDSEQSSFPIQFECDCVIQHVCLLTLMGGVRKGMNACVNAVHLPDVWVLCVCIVSCMLFFYYLIQSIICTIDLVTSGEQERKNERKKNVYENKC